MVDGIVSPHTHVRPHTKRQEIRLVLDILLPVWPVALRRRRMIGVMMMMMGVIIIIITTTTTIII